MIDSLGRVIAMLTLVQERHKPFMLPVNLVILSVRAYASQRPIQLIPSIKTLGGGDSIIGTCDRNAGSLQVGSGWD